MTLLKKFICNDSGATAVEYGLIAALVTAALLGGGKLLGESLNDRFGDVAVEMDSKSDDGLSYVGGGGD